MYLIKVISKSQGHGWFSGFPTNESKSFITDKISLAHQYNKKETASVRKQEILKRTDAATVEIIPMNTIQYLNNLKIEGIILPTETGDLKAKITGSQLDLLAAINYFAENFDIIEISDIMKNASQEHKKHKKVHITYRHKL